MSRSSTPKVPLSCSNHSQDSAIRFAGYFRASRYHRSIAGILAPPPSLRHQTTGEKMQGSAETPAHRDCPGAEESTVSAPKEPKRARFHPNSPLRKQLTYTKQSRKVQNTRNCYCAPKTPKTQRAKPIQPRQLGAPGASPLGTWETTNLNQRKRLFKISPSEQEGCLDSVLRDDQWPSDVRPRAPAGSFRVMK